MPDRRFATLPSSAAQRGQWLIDRMGEPSAAYTIPTAVWISGTFDVDAARAAVRAVVRRHEALRTTFAWDGRTLTQLVADPDHAEVDFAVESVPDEDAAVAVAIADAAKPFDLRRGPLLRVRVYQVAADLCLMVVAVHHMVFDGWSEGLFFREFAAYYDDPAADLAEPPLQYADFAQWQSERIAAGELEPTARFWADRLAGVPALELPADRSRSAVQAHHGREVRFTVDAELFARVRRLAADEGTTVFAVLFSAFRAVLGRYSGQSDVAVGVPVSNRPLPELEQVIGLFVNNVVLRVPAPVTATFRDLVAATHAEFLDVIEHSELPVPHLVERLAPDRDLSRNPLYQAGFSVEERPTEGVRLGRATLRQVDLHLGTSKFDVCLVCYLDGDELTGLLEYDSDLFDESMVSRVANAFADLLAAAVARPDATLRDLGTLTGAALAEAVCAINDTARAFPDTATIADLLGEQLRARPDAIAARTADRALTYAELARRATPLAHRLRALGAGPDALVGVCIPRSPELLVALVGIALAGGAYLPLEPDHPTDRLRDITAGAGPVAVVGCAETREQTSALGFPVVDVDAAVDAAVDGDHGDVPPPAPVGDAENLAYVIYTSGSTGRPKGIAVSQRALARLVRNPDYAELRPGDAHLSMSPLSFDASLLDIWGALLNGGSVVFPRRDLPFPENLRDALETHRIDTALLVSPQLHVAAERFPEQLAGVRQLLVGGDVLSPAHAELMLAHRAAGSRFTHVYGPTECTLFATAYEMTGVDTTRPTVPIGRPITNTRAYVLDDALDPVPVGVAGELCLGGAGLARGYFGRPGLTADRFVPDPFGSAGERVYRTGDLVRLLPSGQLEFLGRLDDQVKIRGYRIETGEVRAVLSSHPAVREAAVVARDDGPGGTRALVAYLVPRGEPAGDDELRATVRGRLPEYMLPAAFVWLDSIPLTANGKADRAALPPPRYARAGAGPRTPTEEAVRETWQQVLGVGDIDRASRFFDVGGNSLLLAELFEQLHERFPDAGLSLVELFEFPTWPDLAAEVDRRTATRVPATADYDI